MKFYLLMIVIGIAASTGWCMNAYKFVTCDFEPSYKAEAIRAIGIVVPPIGAVAGYVELGQ